MVDARAVLAADEVFEGLSVGHVCYEGSSAVSWPLTARVVWPGFYNFYRSVIRLYPCGT